MAFAYDLILFSRGDPNSVKLIMECVSKFSASSGLQAICLKSNIYTAGIGGVDLDEIRNITNVSNGEFPFHYLGIPLASTRPNSMHYSTLTNRIASQIAAWPGQTLSFAGKLELELIRSVNQGMNCFWLAIFLICKYVMDLLSKAMWNIQDKKDSLWAKWINQYNLRGRSLWEVSSKHDDSPLFKKIVEIKNSLLISCGDQRAAVNQIQQWIDGNQISCARAYQFWRPKGQKAHWHSVVWAKGLTPKFCFVLWLAAKRRLSTNDKRLDEGMDLSFFFWRNGLIL
ncbi:uncharacterized protein LOC131144049 [Malania oleifera]|uniref:uncharacterized protein LOC131144049 n=1 Tax=Malania oleifera TaxID=397392 RepID=UPI0025ADC3A7|nr:uncharacterized protein LOC131144049 [Malania oleifera]